jgi:hypothetical protein
MTGRPWRAEERRVVLRGFWGRFFIAIEPFTIALVFVGLTLALVLLRPTDAPFVGPIFAVAALVFLTYAIVLMVPVTRALLETFGTISIVDGYVRYRVAEAPGGEPMYYVAVLDEQRMILGEWPLAGRPGALDRSEPWPALVEFTPHAGIHRSDGQSTGVLPDDIPPLGVGASDAFGRKKFFELSAEERARSSSAVDIITESLRRLVVDSDGEWEGTPADLWSELSSRVSEGITRTRHWPKSPKGVADRLARHIPDLAEAGIAVSFAAADGKGRRLISIRKAG